MHIGFILTKTYAQESFQTFLKFLNIYLGKNDISIFLLGNGVFCARNGHSESITFLEILEKGRILACWDDLQARGIGRAQLIPGVETFENYETIVLSIMEDVDEVLSF